ncbi:MAG: winged helix-turn-helix domain-containing protein [Anaerolineae bacterium]
MTALTLTPTLARRLAVTRQRLAGPRPAPTPAGLMELLRDVRCLQIDPIRAVERTQYLVPWSRLGNYNPAHLDALLWQEKQLFEYWAHAASIVLTEDFPIHQAQMRRLADHNSTGWSWRARDWFVQNAPFKDYILAELDRRGPLSAGQLEDRSLDPWQSGGWTAGRNVTIMLSFLWEQGDIAVAGRNGLRKKWDLLHRHLPPTTPRDVLPADEVVRRAAQLSLRGLGVGTARHITNHFVRGFYPNLDAILAELAAAGTIIPAQIVDDGTSWPGEWYIHAQDLPLLERLAAGDWQPRTTLLSPFDNLICDRDRAELLWNFHFRIEIYVPRAKRQYGYYVMPILHGERLIGRIDPKMERKTGVLRINAVYAEPDAPQNAAAGRAVAAAITELARFLGAGDIVYGKPLPPGWRQWLG